MNQGCLVTVLENSGQDAVSAGGWVSTRLGKAASTQPIFGLGTTHMQPVAGLNVCGFLLCTLGLSAASHSQLCAVFNPNSRICRT